MVTGSLARCTMPIVPCGVVVSFISTRTVTSKKRTMLAPAARRAAPSNSPSMMVVNGLLPLHARLELVHMARRPGEIRRLGPCDDDLHLAPGVTLLVERPPAARVLLAPGGGYCRTTSMSEMRNPTPALSSSEVGFAQPPDVRGADGGPARRGGRGVALRRDGNAQVVARRQRREEAQVLRRVVAAARERDAGGDRRDSLVTERILHPEEPLAGRGSALRRRCRKVRQPRARRRRAGA